MADVRRIFSLLPSLVLLAACVTTAPSPVNDAITSYCADPIPVVRYADEDGLPYLYDDALSNYVPEGPRNGVAARFVETAMEDGLVAQFDGRFAGEARCILDVAILNAILPDKTRFTPLSGQKSFLVEARLLAPNGTMLAQTDRPFTILSDHQSSPRGGSAWRRIGNTQSLRAEAIATLTDASAVIIADAFSGGRTQSGLSGSMVAYPARVALAESRLGP